MKKVMWMAMGVAAVMALGGCAATGGSSGGNASGGSSGGSSSGKVAFLMPDEASTRYELQDKPLFEAEMKKLCPDCQVLYQNAGADANKQQQQANSVISQGAKVIVLDAVDTTAAATIVTSAQSQGVKVITYDRPITAKPADYYISFDNEAIGKSIAQSLVEDLKATDKTTGVLQVNGSPTDAAAGLIKKGVTSVLSSSGIPVLASYDTPNWDPAQAQSWVSGQITKYGDKISGVVAANDGTGGGTIAAFKAAGVTPVPPVTGNDATIAGIQLIIVGDQYNTISKPIKIVATAAAKVAYQYLQGKKVAGKTTLFNTPTQLFEPTVVTQKNVKSVIFDGGIYSYKQICTAQYASACAKLDIQQ
ncbi:sugar ABC transporter substrate-binding protein [Curtobacterium sp. RRHDQ10]|uniref:ABC transporter substrate-binding protein n=1 Tax=Curtobacterium phyllosphaerae TaxID=3413379 RepID=UPI003BF3F193